MYRIIGGDGKEYGPVSEDQIRDWIAQGRANSRTKVRADTDADWGSLGDVAAFREFFKQGSASGAQSEAPPLPGPSSPGELADRAAVIDSGAAFFGRGLPVYSGNFLVLFGASACMILVLAACSLTGAIPFIGIITGTVLPLIVGGPMFGGCVLVGLRAARGQPVGVGMAFEGFGEKFVPLMLVSVVSHALIVLAGLPGIILMVISLVWVGFEAFKAGPTGVPLLLALAGSAYSLIVVIFLTARWLFAIPLVADRGLDFWTAMKVSWKATGKGLISVLVFWILLTVLLMIGLAMCGVGALFTAPWGIAALAVAYEQVFGERTSAST